MIVTPRTFSMKVPVSGAQRDIRDIQFRGVDAPAERVVRYSVECGTGRGLVAIEGSSVMGIHGTVYFDMEYEDRQELLAAEAIRNLPASFLASSLKINSRPNESGEISIGRNVPEAPRITLHTTESSLTMALNIDVCRLLSGIVDRQMLETAEARMQTIFGSVKEGMKNLPGYTANIVTGTTGGHRLIEIEGTEFFVEAELRNKFGDLFVPIRYYDVFTTGAKKTFADNLSHLVNLSFTSFILDLIREKASSEAVFIKEDPA